MGLKTLLSATYDLWNTILCIFKTSMCWIDRMSLLVWAPWFSKPDFRHLVFPSPSSSIAPTPHHPTLSSSFAHLQLLRTQSPQTNFPLLDAHMNWPSRRLPGRLSCWSGAVHVTWTRRPGRRSSAQRCAAGAPPTPAGWASSTSHPSPGTSPGPPGTSRP